MLGLELRLGEVGRGHTLHARINVTRCLFNSNIFVTSAALAEVCALPSAVLIMSEEVEEGLVFWWTTSLAAVGLISRC